MLSDAQEQLQLRSKSLNETCSTELAELNEEISNLQTVKVGLVFIKVLTLFSVVEVRAAVHTTC